MHPPVHLVEVAIEKGAHGMSSTTIGQLIYIYIYIYIYMCGNTYVYIYICISKHLPSENFHF